MWLHVRVGLVVRCVVLVDRVLGKIQNRGYAAVLGIGNVSTRVKRRALLEVMEICKFLLYVNQKHTRVAATTSWDGLLMQGGGSQNGWLADQRRVP